jgi:hypothetical protein
LLRRLNARRRFQMGRSVTIELDEALYGELERLARERGEGLSEALTEALEAYLKQRKAYVNDPFFQLRPLGSSGLGDLSEKHDQYLYGTKRADEDG